MGNYIISQVKISDTQMSMPMPYPSLSYYDTTVISLIAFVFCMFCAFCNFPCAILFSSDTCKYHKITKDYEDHQEH